MATKRGFSLPDDGYMDICNGIDVQYNNLNLNQKLQKCLHTFSEPSKSTTFNKRNSFDVAKNDNGKYVSLSWKKKAKDLSPYLKNDYGKKEDGFLKKNTTTNKSTLSLHVAAYEKSVEDSSGLPEAPAPNLIRNHRLKMNKVGLNKQLFVGSIIENPFEFPRQQSDNLQNPELMEFTASQALYSPNQPASSNPRMPLPSTSQTLMPSVTFPQYGLTSQRQQFFSSQNTVMSETGVYSHEIPSSLPYTAEYGENYRSADMPTHADELLQSLLGEVQTSYGGAIDISEIVSKSTKTSRIQVSPPKLFIEDAKDKERREKREKGDKEKHNISSKHSSSKALSEKPWLIEPMKKMPVVDDLPIGADFQLFHPKIKEDQPKDSSSKKEKKKKKDKEKEKSSKKKKKKSKEDEQKERLELVPRTLSMKNLPPSEPKSRKDTEDGEIYDDGQNNGWMSLSAEKAKNLETTDDILKRKLDKAHKKKKKKDKEKEEDKSKDKEEKSSSSKKHKSKKDKKDLSKDKLNETDNLKGKDKDKSRESKDRHHTNERNRGQRDERERERLKSTGCLVKPLTPKESSSEKSKILPASWSKQLNNLLKDSNQEFSSSSKDHESSRDKDKQRSAHENSTSHHRKHSDGRDKSHRDQPGPSHHRSRDHEKDEHYSVPKRRDRSRSRTPAVGRGRNFFRRTDAEWREHQIERIRKRNQSPVRIHKEDYMDKYGNIDKKKLMDVATRNVTKLAMCGALPKGYELLSTIKNKTVQQLVDLCQQLHDDDERARFGRPSSSESDGDDDDRYCGGWENDNTFSLRDVKEPEKPRYEVIDGTPFLVKTEEEQRHEDSFLRVSYPVSSGMEHRQKELEPAEDEIQPLALSTALARIKTNIPPAFINSLETQMFPLIEPMKPLPLPPPEPPSKAFSDFTASLSSSTGQNQDMISNMLGTTETLNRPIEIAKPTETQIKAISPVIPSKKPLIIRASFLKSGKKAAEEALKKILPGPEPVPAPDLSIFANTASNNVASVSSNNVSKTPEPIPLPYTLSLDPIVPIEPKKSAEVQKDVTHSDALSAILDRVDQLMTQGKINEMATIEKKDLNVLKSPEKISENYVKIPAGGIVKKEPVEPTGSRMEEVVQENKKEVEKDKNEDAKMEGDIEQQSIQDQSSEITIITEDEPKEKKKKEKKDKKEKKEKKRKHHGEEMEEGEIREKKPRISLKTETSRKTFGPEIPDIVKKERPLPSAIANDFDYRSPLPFIKALTAPQLAIEAVPAKGSLKAEWNDPRNPLVSSIKDDDSIPLPFRIIPPTVQPLVKPEDLVFKTPRCITHPPRMINDLVSRRAKYSIILQQDPNDRYARRQIEEIDRDMSAWAESKNIPGRFTGRTGARVLSVDELAPSDPRYNSWARKDLFLSAPEHESEFGKKILESMGWQKGNGLGRQMNGTKEPLKLDIKADRRGLYTGNEKGSGRRETIQDVNGKNPVSLVMEYTSRHRLQPPTFTCIESGPSTSRRFLWKVTIDGVEYEPSMPSSNKKAGKAQVCVVVLQSLGLIPP